MKKSAILKLRYVLVGLLLAMPATANEGSETPTAGSEAWYCKWFGICPVIVTSESGELDTGGSGKEPPQ